MALSEKKDGGEDGAEDIGNGQRDPDSIETVPAKMDEKDGNEDAHGDEENDLPRQTGDDGNPRFVNGLEEVGVDNGEADEREHHHAESQSGFPHFNQMAFCGENAHHRSREDAGNNTPEQTDGHANPHSQAIHVFQPVAVACSVVVSGNRLHTLTDSYNHEYQEVAVCITNPVGTHGKVTAITQKLRIEDSDHPGGGQIHQKRTHADERDVLEDVPFQLPSVRFETDKRRGLHKMQDGHQRHGENGDGGSDSRALDAHIQSEDQDGVEDDVEDGTAGHNQHGFGGIAGSTYQAGEVERHRNQKHARQDVHHILACVSHRFRRRTEHQQDAVKEKIAEQNH